MPLPATKTIVFTDLTCWKCGEESLKEVVKAEEARGPKGEKLVSSAIRHSSCEKCGAYSVNPAQLHHNRVAARISRKSIIKEANRKSG
jgi:hypothetical protein